MQEGSVIAIYFKWGHFTIPYFAPTQLLKYLITVHCSKSSFFVQKFNFDCARKLSMCWVKNSWKGCGYGLFSFWQLWFHEKNCQIIWGGKLVKMLGFCQNWIFGQKFDFSNSVIVSTQKGKKEEENKLTYFLEHLKFVLFSARLALKSSFQTSNVYLSEDKKYFYFFFHFLQMTVFSFKRIEKKIVQHTIRNLHFLAKKSTLISRENCRFFWMKNSWKCCGFGLFSC